MAATQDSVGPKPQLPSFRRTPHTCAETRFADDRFDRSGGPRSSFFSAALTGEPRAKFSRRARRGVIIGAGDELGVLRALVRGRNLVVVRAGLELKRSRSVAANERASTK